MSNFKETGVCAICKGMYTHFGNNPQPVLPRIDQRVCDDCNETKVIPARLASMLRKASRA